MRIADDGCGFARRNGNGLGGNGLRNMAKRAAELGGSCTVGANDGGGTVVLLRVPIHRHPP